MQNNLLGLLFGAVFGASLSLAFVIPSVQRLVEQPATTEAFLPCDGRKNEIVEQRDKLLAEIETLRPQWEKASKVRLDLEGAPIPWPEDVAEGLRPASVKNEVETTVQASRNALTIESWHCDEFPCIVAITSKRKRYLDEAMDSMTKRGKGSLRFFSRSARQGESPKRHMVVFTYWKGEPTDAMRKRIAWRMDQIIATFMDANKADVP